MTAHQQPAMPPAVPGPEEAAARGLWSSPPPPSTMDGRLRSIEALKVKIVAHADYMGQVGSLGGSSTEAKENAVTTFHERMIACERQLARIREELRLG